MDGETLEKLYQERLEERIISYLAEKHKIDCLDAMDWYYNSELAEKIHTGENGIQYLDYKLLADILTETEPKKFTESTHSAIC